MKILNLLIITALLVFASCTKVVVASKPAPKPNPNGKVPPGQMKKAMGTQSAKPYAPGQQKKATGTHPGKSSAPGQQKKKK